MRLSDIKLFLLDMDGTFYLGDRLLPGARQFLFACDARDIGYTFLTNNSSKSSADYIEKLARLGVSVSPEQMLTSGDAALHWLARQPFGKEILLIGTPSLKAQFRAAGYDTAAPAPRAVVLGFDTTLTYAKLTALCDAVRGGLPYIATHPDYNCPVEGGYIPDIGAVIAFVEASTGRRPDTVIGKPSGVIAQIAAERAGLPLDSLCMVGDRLYTDIAMGQCGIVTALVLSGETTRDMLAQSDLAPDFVFSGLDEMAQRLIDQDLS